MAHRSASSYASKRDENSSAPSPSAEESPALTIIAPPDHDEDGFDWENDKDDLTIHPDTRAVPFDASLLPRGSRSLSSIGLQSFWLGFSLSLCLLTSAFLAMRENTFWRFPAFFACLSLFHFLEYYTTARYNLPATRASSFLLFNNGTAYNIAHSLAASEIVISYFLPSYQSWLVYPPWTVGFGATLIVVGQTVRSVAMAQAGTNFNHTPVRTRAADHELVTKGMYAYFRHPSYFGFFWWALGTQILVGNKLCLAGYAAALWKFFHDRIIAEEKSLVRFFGKDYEAFRERTRTGIPFVR
ncbi:Hypothetical protein R9X50_00573300 [Acrodontium crateriforme]|uniref:Protein-S-isoprenylcysteine O-methyltransferase n=1 Tax=Acrodontium crateriforme TaxID=150365 RepID=A0AAQ3RBR1_9PEZI|nr:Hypothetical protein R9X50_00573300 [Acrodontium crateriforme]